MDMRYIRKSGNNYRIDKCINHKKVYFGAYSSLEDAINARDYFEAKGWENCLNERLDYSNKPTYITGNEKRGYEIRKVLGGKLVHFGTLRDLKWAEEEVELYKQCEWDLDAICEGVDERVNGMSVFNNRRSA